jgi:hypothetical protein
MVAVMPAQPASMCADQPATPHVGIFWRVQTLAAAPPLLVDSVPVEQAETHGDFLIHGGHFEFWVATARLSAPELRKRNLPDVAKWSEYEEWPRGRVVFRVPTRRFILYADRKLQTTAMVKEIVKRFGLPADRVEVRGDEHYVSVR